MRRYSHTALKLAQRCYKAWAYKYIERLEKAERPAHLERGSHLHNGLEYLYDETKEDDLITWWDESSEEDRDILSRYGLEYNAPEENWEVLHVEDDFEMAIGSHFVVFKPDLVVRINEEVWVVDHKTTKNIPDEYDPYNMTDFQHLLYIAGMRQIYPETKGFIFNYIRTKAPTLPKLIKDGSRIGNLRAMDTTAAILQDFAEAHGMDGMEDVQDKLNILRHTPNRYFQRHYIIVPDEAVDQAVADTQAVLDELAKKETLGGPYPRHVLSKGTGYASCSNCDFQAICHADLLGINRDVVLLDYIERPRRDK